MMDRDTIMLWLSSTKPIAAIAIAQLWEQEKLNDDPVAKFIPEFGVNGKEPITIRQILTHTGGFRGLIGNWERPALGRRHRGGLRGTTGAGLGAGT